MTTFFTRIHLYVGIVTLVAIVVGIVSYMKLYDNTSGLIAECDAREQSDAAKIDCWLGVVRDELRTHDLAAAMHVFREIYDSYPMFANSGCHRHAHRVGDMVYYEQYLTNPDIRSLQFPPETTSCGYGFFHGFLEHLIQDNPSEAFITETCEYLGNTYSSNMGDIRITCYHGSGHGLALAQAETVSEREWGNAASFVDVPLATCGRLPLADKESIEECKEGVFNVLVDWMEIREYGFVYDRERPFTVCDRQSSENKRACYYEMDMKLDSVSQYDPAKLAEITNEIRDEKLGMLAFRVGIAGLIQHIVASGKPGEIFDRCSPLEDKYAEACVESIVNGLFEHGRPREEYVTAREFCSSENVIQRGTEAPCWNAFSARLKRFYSQEIALGVCSTLPETYQSRCVKMQS